MKMKIGTSRKLRYGGVTAALTAAIIAIVIVVNVMFSALADKFLWYTDLTPELSFTLSENFIKLMRDGDDEFGNSNSPLEKLQQYREERKAKDPNFDPSSLKIEIIFCNDELTWSKDNTYLMHVWKTAEDFALMFPDDVSVKYVDIIRNPSAVGKYKKDGSKISTDSVIVACGDEYRVRSLRAFYKFDDETSDQPWAYNGEKAFASSIMAVTRSDTPIACFTTNHGETAPGKALLETVQDAGYNIMLIDLSADTNPIPEDCRLIIVSNPKLDFQEADAYTTVDEIERLEDFLDGTNSLMVFMDPDTSPLTCFENFLYDWGIAFERDDQKNPHIVEDRLNSIDEYGYNLTGQYTTAGLGADITDDLQNLNRKIIFPYAMSITYASNVNHATGGTTEEEGNNPYKYGEIRGDGYYREIYDLFVSTESAVTMAGGVQKDVAKNGNNFKLMTVSVEDHDTQESNYTSTNNASYVFAAGCTKFLEDGMFNGQYGNRMFLEYLLRIVAHEPVPVGLTFNPFNDTTIDTIEVADAITLTIVFTVVPVVLATGAGIFVIVRRKNR